MKTKFKNQVMVLSLLSSLGLAGCKKDFLDSKYDVYATPTSVATDANTLYTFGNAMYTPLINNALPYAFTALDGNFFAAASDEAQRSGNVPVGTLAFNQGTLSPINVPTDVNNYYTNMYEGIRAANFYLDYSKNFEEFLARNRFRDQGTSADIAYQRDRRLIGWYRGEARIARAYYYFELSKRYGGVPIITQTLDKTANPNVSKSSFDEVTNFIVSQIDTFKDSLQVNWKTSSSDKDQDGRFSKMSALALKSRVLLYAASPLHNPGNDVTKWQKAAEAARDVITGNFGLSLYTGGYRNYFIGFTAAQSSNPETIMAVRSPASNVPEQANYPIATPGGSSGIAPSHNLVADYEYIGTPDATDIYKNRDPRLAATVVTNNSTWNGRTIVESAGGSDDMAKANTSRTGYYLKKFITDNVNLTQNGTAIHTWILFRYGEILLNYAEAMNEAYGPDAAPAGYTLTARQALQLVRNRASSLLPAVTASSVTDFRNVLKHERRIELAFEDHRYWDLLRWKDAETVLNQPIKGVTVTRNANNTYNYQVVDAASRTFRAPAMYYFPFSQAEIVRSNGTLTQNPGY